MAIRVIAVGKKHESWVSEGIERYQKRLKRPFEIEWVYLPHSGLDGLRAATDESRTILSRLNANDYAVLLDERGKNIDSPALAELLRSPIENGKNVVLIIGGAYGVDGTVRARANFVWSLSDLVFPHQLVRLILTEQIYRAQEIIAGNPYHHI